MAMITPQDVIRRIELYADAGRQSCPVGADRQARRSAVGLADKDTTVVANSGSISFGDGRTVTIGGPVTLEGLASAINDADVGVSASVVRNATGYHLMLTGQETGAANGFTPSEGTLLGGAAALSFTAPQAAQDAEITLNGVTVTSETNTFDSAIAGASFNGPPAARAVRRLRRRDAPPQPAPSAGNRRVRRNPIRVRDRDS